MMADRIAAHVRALREGDDASKTAAARELGSLAFSSSNPENKVLIAQAGGIEPLVQLLHDGSAVAKVRAVWALQNLAEHNGANKLAIAEAGGIPLLVELARERGRRLTLTSRAATVALGILAWNNDANAVAIAAALGFDALVQLARRGRVNFKGYTLVRNAGLPAKRKAALVVAQLIEATAPRTRVPAVLKAAIGSYL
ncbi:hypothetical protein JL722_12104 [Aureococcus anophagefferens]|nr:hypothetical protein JL722_12104 [Aureococcus anophagefferens]